MPQLIARNTPPRYTACMPRPDTDSPAWRRAARWRVRSVAHGVDHSTDRGDRQADGEERQRAGVVGAVAGDDEAGAPEHDEHVRRRSTRRPRREKGGPPERPALPTSE